jgi:hypothetical protein
MRRRQGVDKAMQGKEDHCLDGKVEQEPCRDFESKSTKRCWPGSTDLEFKRSCIKGRYIVECLASRFGIESAVLSRRFNRGGARYVRESNGQHQRQVNIRRV